MLPDVIMERYKKEGIIVAIIGIFCIITLVYLLIKPVNNTPSIIPILPHNVCFNSSNPSSYQSYINNMEIVLNQYKKGKKVMHCHKDYCVPQMKPACENWGFQDGHPCIFFTFSNDSHYNFYNDTYLNDLDKTYFNKLDEWHYGLYQFWITCSDANATDIHYYFPKFNSDGDYLSPLVGVQVQFSKSNGMVLPGEYNVECSLLRQKAYHETEEMEKIFLRIKQGKPCT